MKHYTDEQKQEAARRLAETNGDIALVSLELNISERTLYRWRRKWQEKDSTLPNFPLAFGVSREEWEEQIKAAYQPGEYTELRETLMQHIKALTPTLSEDPDLAHRRVLALSRLLDKVLKLEDMVRVEKPQTFVIKYETPDGFLHDMPYYYNGLHKRASRAYDAVISHARYVYLKNQGYSDEELQYLKGATYEEYQDDSEEWDGEDNPELEAIFEEPITDELLNKPQYSGYLGSILAKGKGYDTTDITDEIDNSLPRSNGRNDNISRD